MLTQDVLHAIDRSVLCWLATADASGMPNVSPKEVFAPWEKRDLLIAHIASPGSVRNLKANPQVCVSFVDVFVQKGYKLRGTADVIKPKTPRYDALQAPLLNITAGKFPIRAILYVQVSAVEPIVAPSYRLFPDISERSRIDSAMKTYGVMPRTPPSPPHAPPPVTLPATRRPRNPYREQNND